MLRDVMVQIFGVYTTVDGHANYEYIGAVALFGITLYCCFRLAGQVFKR